jgi:hypothetical protein
MTIVHVHIERTGGVSLQTLYEKEYPGPEMLWYSTRDDVFAPFNIKTANYTKDWQLKTYAFISRWFPPIRRLMLKLRTWRRKRHAVGLEDLPSKASLVIGHFTANRLFSCLPPELHEYRTVVREPLSRMWSHFNHFQAYKGDVGQRVVPQYKKNMTFEEFAMLPEMLNYQVRAIGSDISIYKHIGVTEELDIFCENTHLKNKTSTSPRVNHFGNTLPDLNPNFVEAFKMAHAQDYELYNSVLARLSKINSR